MIQIAQPFQNFVDIDGQPLNNGYVYIGTSGQNPETNPIAVYWDAALTIAAAQPIRTINGYLARNGSPARLYANASVYSITVRNLNSTLITSALDASMLDNLRADLAAASGAGLVGFDPTLNYVAGTFGAAAYDTIINVKMFPWLATGDGVTDDTAAIQAAITWIATRGGGTLKFPSGSYLETGLAVPAKVYLEGDGARSTSLLYNGSGNAVLLGGTASELYYHLGIKNMRIFMTHVNATAVLAKGTAAAKIHDLYIEGPLTFPRLSRGVVFDGGNASSFFNDARNVVCNHIHIGYELQTTGTLEATSQYFTNCSSFGDVSSDPSSVCLLVNTGQGNGTVWSGGNAESCGSAFFYASNAGSTSIFGARLEGNTFDIYLNTGVRPQTFVGLINLEQGRIFDAAGEPKAAKHTFVGCIDANEVDFRSPYNKWPGTNRFLSLAASTTPVTNRGYAGQAVDVVLNETSAGVRTSGVGSDMNYFGDHFLFPTIQVASSNPNALDDYEEGLWTPIIGGLDGESGQSYVFQKGKYTKIGNQVTVVGDILLSAKGTITGSVVLKGLPFTSNGFVGGAISIGYSTLATATVDVAATIIPSTTSAYLRIKTTAATGPSLAVTADVTDNTQIILSGSYFV